MRFFKRQKTKANDFTYAALVRQWIKSENRKHRFLQFRRVGRNNFSGRKLLHPEIVSADEIAEAAYDEVKKHLKYILTKNVGCWYDPAKHKGIVVAGTRCIGSFSIIEKS